MIACGNDVVDLIANMMDAAGSVSLEKSGDGRIISKRVQEFDFRVWKVDKYDCHTVRWKILRFRNLCAQNISILSGRRIKIRDGDGNVIEAIDHGTLRIYRFLKTGASLIISRHIGWQSNDVDFDRWSPVCQRLQ